MGVFDFDHLGHQVGFIDEFRVGVSAGDDDGLQSEGEFPKICSWSLWTNSASPKW